MRRSQFLSVAPAASALLVALPAGAQTAKKVVRIHTAGPNDVNVETTMLAVQFADYVNNGHGRGQGFFPPASWARRVK